MSEAIVAQPRAEINPRGGEKDKIRPSSSPPELGTALAAPLPSRFVVKAADRTENLRELVEIARDRVAHRAGLEDAGSRREREKAVSGEHDGPRLLHRLPGCLVVRPQDHAEGSGRRDPEGGAGVPPGFERCW